MKRNLHRYFSFLMILPILLAGCAPAVPQEATPSDTTPTQPKEDLIDPNQDGALKILFLGNSFSYDIAETFWNVADSLLDKEIHIGILGIGACTLVMHSRNLHFGNGEYEYKSTNNGVWKSVLNVPANGYISGENWDYIVIQQASHQSGKPDSYDPHLKNVVDQLKALCPGARILWHMTWAYEPDCEYTYFSNYDHDTMKMYNAIVDTVKSTVLANEDIFAVIPSGTAIQNARTVKEYANLCRDGFHLSIPYGRYVVALGLAALLIDPNLSQVTWKPQGVNDAQMQIAIEAAKNAVEKPYEVTPVDK